MSGFIEWLCLVSVTDHAKFIISCSVPLC